VQTFRKHRAGLSAIAGLSCIVIRKLKSIFCFDFKDPAVPADEKKDVEAKKLLSVSLESLSK